MLVFVVGMGEVCDRVAVVLEVGEVGGVGLTEG